MSPTNDGLETRVAQLEAEVAELKDALAGVFESSDPLEAAFNRFRSIIEAKRKAPTLRRA